MKHLTRQLSTSGMTLLGVIVFSTIGAMMAYFLTTSLMMSSRQQRNLEIRGELDGVRRHLLESGFDCMATLNPFCNTGTPNLCDGGEIPECPQGANASIEVKGRNGATLIGAGGTQFGDWSLLADCEEKKGIRVLAVKPKPGKAATSTTPSDFQPDPLVKSQVYDRNHPRSDLFRSSGSAPCTSFFGGGGGISTCQPGQIITGVDFSSGTLSCGPAPVAPPSSGGSAELPTGCTNRATIKFDGSKWVCQPAPTYAQNYTTKLNIFGGGRTARVDCQCDLVSPPSCSHTYSSWLTPVHLQVTSDKRGCEAAWVHNGKFATPFSIPSVTATCTCYKNN